MNASLQFRTLKTFSLALAVFSWREWLRTDRLWWRFSERPSWRPPELPSLPSLSPDAASDGQLKHKWLHERQIWIIWYTLFKKWLPSYLSTDGGTRAVVPDSCSTGADWGTITAVWNTENLYKSSTSYQKLILPCNSSLNNPFFYHLFCTFMFTTAGENRFQLDCPPDGVIYPGETICIQCYWQRHFFSSTELNIFVQWSNSIQNVAIFSLLHWSGYIVI